MTVRGHVRSGRLVVDTPTDLPEGSEVELVTVADDREVPAPLEAMLDRWRAQDVSAEPDWDAREIPSLALRRHGP
jgi:hypothetical protein